MCGKSCINSVCSFPAAHFHCVFLVFLDFLLAPFSLLFTRNLHSIFQFYDGNEWRCNLCSAPTTGAWGVGGAWRSNKLVKSSCQWSSRKAATKRFTCIFVAVFFVRPFLLSLCFPSLNCKFENIFLFCSSHFLLRTAVKAVSKAPAENNASNTLSRCEWWRVHTSIYL